MTRHDQDTPHIKGGSEEPALKDVSGPDRGIETPRIREFVNLRNEIEDLPDGEAKDSMRLAFAELVERVSKRAKLFNRAGETLADLKLDLRLTQFDNNALRRELAEQAKKESEE